MDSGTGQVYPEAMVEYLKPKIQKRLVRIEGTPKNIHKISKAVKDKNKKKAAKASRKKNRR